MELYLLSTCMLSWSCKGQIRLFLSATVTANYKKKKIVFLHIVIITIIIFIIIIIIIIVIIIEFLTSQLWLGNIHISLDAVISRIRLGDLIYSLKSLLQLNLCQE